MTLRDEIQSADAIGCSCATFGGWCVSFSLMKCYRCCTLLTKCWSRLLSWWQSACRSSPIPMLPSLSNDPVVSIWTTSESGAHDGFIRGLLCLSSASNPALVVHDGCLWMDLFVCLIVFVFLSSGFWFDSDFAQLVKAQDKMNVFAAAGNHTFLIPVNKGIEVTTHYYHHDDMIYMYIQYNDNDNNNNNNNNNNMIIIM